MPGRGLLSIDARFDKAPEIDFVKLYKAVTETLNTRVYYGELEDGYISLTVANSGVYAIVDYDREEASLQIYIEAGDARILFDVYGRLVRALGAGAPRMALVERGLGLVKPEPGKFRLGELFSRLERMASAPLTVKMYGVGECSYLVYKMYEGVWAGVALCPVAVKDMVTSVRLETVVEFEGREPLLPAYTRLDSLVSSAVSDALGQYIE